MCNSFRGDSVSNDHDILVRSTICQRVKDLRNRVAPFWICVFRGPEFFIHATADPYSCTTVGGETPSSHCGCNRQRGAEFQGVPLSEELFGGVMEGKRWPWDRPQLFERDQKDWRTGRKP